MKPTTVVLIAAALAAPLPTLAEPFRLIVTHLEPPLVPNSVMDLAVELGYFTREGVEVELIRVQQTPLAVAALLAGEGDMANVGVDAVLQLQVQGTTTLKAVTSPNKSLPFLIAAKDAIATPRDLVGHSFGVGRIGSLDHALSTRVLASEGVAMSALDVVTLGQPNVRAQSLAAGQIDATTMSIGTWKSLPDKTGLHVLISPDAYYAAAPVVNKVNVVTDATLSDRRADVVAVVRALTLISRDFSQNPDVWSTAMAPFATQLNAEALTELGQSFAGGWSVNGGLSKTELQFTHDWVFATDDFKGAAPVSLDAWVDFSIADQVLAEIGVDQGSDIPAR
ncbi:MAG: ABC transporter substrate-binding protein [Verrucomicrobia bacterium]|nr:ABC transporter substrate-binding protein [Verrucomicrobiota bacterium]